MITALHDTTSEITGQKDTMHKKASKVLLLYGLFSTSIGFAGFLTNPERGKTALTAVALGAFAILLSEQMRRGAQWGFVGALVVVGAGILGYGGQAFRWWLVVADGGEQATILTAIMLTLLTLASMLALPLMLRAFQRQTKFLNILSSFQQKK